MCAHTNMSTLPSSDRERPLENMLYQPTECRRKYLLFFFFLNPPKCGEDGNTGFPASSTRSRAMGPSTEENRSAASPAPDKQKKKSSLHWMTSFYPATFGCQRGTFTTLTRLILLSKIHCTEKRLHFLWIIAIKINISMISSIYSSNNCSVVILTAVIKRNI